MTTKCSTCLDSRHKPHYRFTFKDFDNNYLNELRKNRSTLPRVIWLILFLFMIGSSLYIAIQLLIQYTNYESYNLENSELATSYTLPAFTICNLNPLDYTAMAADKVTVNGAETSVYDLYANLHEAYKLPGTDTSGYNDFEGIDDIDIFVDYRMEPAFYYIPDLTTFAQGKQLPESLVQFAYTASGMCLEVNDGWQNLVQQVPGVAGGLHMVLDTKSERYLPLTQDQGFRINLRSANETVLNQDHGFTVAPGNEYYINVRTASITRLPPKWGHCQDLDNIFTGAGYFSLRECFFNQHLWMHPRLYEDGCACYPWYFYQRFFADQDSMNFNEDTKWRLIRFWTEGLQSPYNFQFEETCQYMDGHLFTSKHLETSHDVASAEYCISGCEDHPDCRYFMYSTQDNDEMKIGECRYFEKHSHVQESDSSVGHEGLIRGDTQCVNMDKCTPSQTVRCENLIMNELMSRDADVDSKGRSNLPPDCHEPCSYEKHEYSLSSTSYPTKNHWDQTLSKTVTWYGDYDTAKNNLMKLVFYTDVMETTTVAQTASYEAASFISEVGGLTDLFMGLSFYTIYQILEWVITLVFCRKRAVKSEDDDDCVVGTNHAVEDSRWCRE